VGQLAQLGVGTLAVHERLVDQRRSRRVCAHERAARELERDHRVHEALLRAVVQVAHDPSALCVRGRQDTRPRGLDLAQVDAFLGLLGAQARVVGDVAGDHGGQQLDADRDDVARAVQAAVEGRDRSGAGDRGQQAEPQPPVDGEQQDAEDVQDAAGDTRIELRQRVEDQRDGGDDEPAERQAEPWRPPREPTPRALCPSHAPRDCRSAGSAGKTIARSDDRFALLRARERRPASRS
jgi:hypothetical protein